MKNKPVETRKKKGKEEGKRERGRERRTQRHRDAYAITPTERFKFSPNYWAVFHVVRASKLSLPFILIFPLGSTCFISLFLSLLYVYLYVISSSYFLSLSLFFSPDCLFPATFEIKVDRVSTRASCRALRSWRVDLSLRSLSVVRHELLLKRTTNDVGIEKISQRRS